MHEHSRSLSGGPNDLNRQNSPGRPPYPGDRNIGMSPLGAGHPQRPTNLGLEASPRKHVLETKTDYGKYRFVLNVLNLLFYKLNVVNEIFVHIFYKDIV